MSEIVNQAAEPSLDSDAEERSEQELLTGCSRRETRQQ